MEKKVITKEKLVKLKVEDDKVFLYMNGIQVFDYADGKPLWAAVYDQTPSDVVKSKKPAVCLIPNDISIFRVYSYDLIFHSGKKRAEGCCFHVDHQDRTVFER